MQIKLTFEEIYDILSEEMKRRNKCNTIMDWHLFTTEVVDGEIIERPPKEPFSGAYFDLIDV